MTRSNRETLERAIGMIEGASFGAPDYVGAALETAVEMIEAVLTDDFERNIEPR